MADGSLDADIGLFEAVAIQVGIVIGAGLFAVTGEAVGDAGPGVALSYTIAIVAISLSIVPTAVLGSLYPTIGGNYRYPSRLWSPRVAFLAAWGMAASVLAGGLPLYGLTFGQYLDSFVAVDVRLVGFVVITGFFLVNLFGIEPAARVQQILLLTLAAGLVVFIVVGAPAVESGNLSSPFPNGLGGVLVGAALLYFVSMGANFIVDIGGELREAALTIPRSFLVSIPLILVVYVLVSAVAVGVVGWEGLADEPLSVAADAALPSSLAAFFTLGALFAIATTVNAVYMIAPKYLLVLAEDGIFPSAFATVNDRFGTAHWGLAFVYLVTLPFILFRPLSVEQHSSIMAFGSLFLVVPVMISAISLLRHRPAAYDDAPYRVDRRLLYATAGGGVVVNVALLGLLATVDSRMFVAWVAFVVLGIGYYAVRDRYLAANGAGLSERMDELPEP